MKLINYIVFLIILSCNNKTKQIEKYEVVDSTKAVAQSKKLTNTRYHTNLDTIIIPAGGRDTLKYSKEDFNKIVDTHPEFFPEYPANPDQTYNEAVKKGFTSELGQDFYYMLFAYFLKQRNGIKKYAAQRKKLISIYLDLNSLFDYFQYGGTYFGHQARRIPGYAEYSIYLLPKHKENIQKTYDISKQRNLYLQSLRQLIDDESKIDFMTLGKDKIKRNKDLNKIVDHLGTLITDNFYLRQAQQFHYTHYEYY